MKAFARAGLSEVEQEMLAGFANGDIPTCARGLEMRTGVRPDHKIHRWFAVCRHIFRSPIDGVRSFMSHS